MNRFVLPAYLVFALLITPGMPRSGLASDPLPESIFPHVCGVQLKSHNFTVENLDRAHRLGFRIVRRGFYWASVERQQGRYDFSDYDPQMEHARRLGLTVVGCLFGNHAAYEDDGQGGIQSEAGRRGFARFAAALADHYRDDSVIWEIWNEPNVRTFWRKSGQHNSPEFAAEYTALVREVVPAMLAADPDCFVAAGSVSNYWQPSYDWTESCFKEGILESGIRGWSVHPYGVKTPEEFAIGHQRMRALLKQYGAAELPLLNTERGFAVKETEEGWSGGSKPRAREFQAWNFVRQFLIDQWCGVRLTVWYEWDGQEFGLVDQGDPRPMLAACEKMVEQLSGYRLVRRIDAQDELDYVLLFENADGDRKLVAWTAPPPGGAPDEAGRHEVSLQTLPVAPGAERAEASAPPDHGTGTIRMTLSGEPQYRDVSSEYRFGRLVSLAPRMVDRTVSGVPQAGHPEGAVNLTLFAEGTEWVFEKNTGDGSFALSTAEDSKPIGILQYDFSKSKSRSTPYVLASTPVDIAAGTRELWIHARSPIAQQLTFRMLDSTEQTHQFKRRIKGTGQWEAIPIPLDRRFEHWGGANDGKLHFPIQRIVFSVPLPKKDVMTGSVEYADLMIVRDQIQPAPRVPQPVPLADGSLDLSLFGGEAEWQFLKNTGAGSFSAGTADDGRPIGILNYDFSKSKSRSTPYVLASTPVDITAGATELRILARSTIPQQLTFRVLDSTEQTHQFKARIAGSGQWEAISIPLTRRLEHWGGAKDGQIHFPIKSLVFCVPLPSENHRTGAVEYTGVALTRGRKISSEDRQ